MKKKFYKLNNKSFSLYKVKTYRGLWNKLKKKGYKGIEVDTFANLKKKKDSEDTFRVVLSTAKEDRHYDIVKQDGWDLKNFKKNPVVLDSHNYDSIDHIIGKITKIGVKDNKLKGDIVFAEMNPKGLMAKQMAEAGFINAVSVGFIPKEFDDKGKILKSELLELSIVSVPANPEALFEKINKHYEKNKTKDNKQKATGTGNNVESKKDEKSKSERKQNNDSKGNGTEIKKARNNERQQNIQKSKETNKIKTIAFAIKEIGEEIKRNSVTKITDRADFNRAVNKAIRNLINLKNNK